MLKEIIAVFIGGGLGSVLRYLVNKIEIISENNFPYSTFISNFLGCFILGLVLGYFIKNENPNSILFVFLSVLFVSILQLYIYVVYILFKLYICTHLCFVNLLN